MINRVSNLAQSANKVAERALARPITEVIPQCPPFLFVDKVVQGIPGKYAVSTYAVQADNPVFAGHFPDFPILPGVLLIENMAQTACWVMAAQAQSEDNADDLFVLARVNQCTFRRMVRPNDHLETRAELTRDLGQFAMFDCQISVGGENVANAELLVARRVAPTVESTATTTLEN